MLATGNFEAENRYAHVCLLYHGLPGSPARPPAPERFGCGVPKQLLTNWKYRPGLGEEANPVTENLMNAPTSSSAGVEKLLSSVDAEISRLVEQKTRNPPTQIEADPERIKAAIARLPSNSFYGLE